MLYVYVNKLLFYMQYITCELYCMKANVDDSRTIAKDMISRNDIA